MRWQGMNVLIVPRRHWSQDNLSAFQKHRDDADVTEEQPIFECYSTVLAANEHKPADIDATLDSDSYNHLNAEQKSN